jgi:hypothetical protein
LFQIDFEGNGNIFHIVLKEHPSGFYSSAEKGSASYPSPLTFNISIGKRIPYEEILKGEKEKDIDLIVISSYGTTELQRCPVGSVAEKVIKGTECPLLLVKNNLFGFCRATCTCKQLLLLSYIMEVHHGR